MTDAPKTIWVDPVSAESGFAYTCDPFNPYLDQYTLTSSIAAQLKAADELAAQAQLDGDTDGISDEMWQALDAYRKAKDKAQ